MVSGSAQHAAVTADDIALVVLPQILAQSDTDLFTELEEVVIFRSQIHGAKAEIRLRASEPQSPVHRSRSAKSRKLFVSNGTSSSPFLGSCHGRSVEATDAPG